MYYVWWKDFKNNTGVYILMQTREKIQMVSEQKKKRLVSGFGDSFGHEMLIPQREEVIASELCTALQAHKEVCLNWLFSFI